MPRASGSRTGKKHKKRKHVDFDSANGPSSGRKLDGLQAAVASVEAALQSHGAGALVQPLRLEALGES